MSRLIRLLKQTPSAQVSSALTGDFVTPSAITTVEPTFAAVAVLTTCATTITVDGISSRNYTQYFNIATTGNTTLFALFGWRPITLYTYVNASSGHSAVGSSTRGIFQQGEFGGGFLLRNLEYLTFATKGSMQYFATMTSYGGYRWTCASATRGIFGGGNLSDTGSFGGVRKALEYVTMATTGTITSFGDMGYPSDQMNGLSSTTRGVFGGNNVAAVYGRTVDLEYITIATTGNATNFGDMTTNAGFSPATASSSTRGLFMTGYSNNLAAGTTTTDYITIATTGNGTSFGDVIQKRQYSNGVSSSIRAVLSGGYDGATTYASMEYYTIASTGTATSFGDMLGATSSHAGASNSHGGI